MASSRSCLTFDNVYAPDTTTWRLYAAEQSIAGGQRFATVDEASDYTKSVLASRWWHDHYADLPQITLTDGGITESDGRITSFAQPDRNYLPTKWIVELHPEMRVELVVLHELAHCVTPRWSGDAAPLRRGKLDGIRQHESHGSMFAATMNNLVATFGTGENHTDLSDAYKHFGVSVAASTDLYKALKEAPLIEQAWMDGALRQVGRSRRRTARKRAT